jgi:hypothetical protein
MRHVVPTCLVALGLAATAAAQETKITKETTIKADDAKSVVVTGCLAGGPATFSLTNAAVLNARDRSSERGAVGTSGSVATYSLAARDGVDLNAHVGHKVEVTGVMLEKGKDDGEVEITERTRIERDDAPDDKVKSRTEIELERGEGPKLAVTSVKMVSSICQ